MHGLGLLLSISDSDTGIQARASTILEGDVESLSSKASHASRKKQMELNSRSYDQ